MHSTNLKYRALHIAATIGLLVVVASMSGAASPASLAERIDKVVEETNADLIELRRDLHRHPELAGEEVRTAGVITKYLEALGLEVKSGVGGHGVIGVLHGGKPGPVVAYRADMDAHATSGPDPAPFASEDPAVRHVCGHDIHVTVGLGIAAALSEVRDDLAGTVKFLFQPAEENATGARSMIEDNAMVDPIPGAIYAVHCAPLPTGQFGSAAGMLLPGLDIINIALSGDGDLVAAAEKCAQIIAGVSTQSGMAPSHDDNAMEAALVPGSFIMAGVFNSEAVAGGWSLDAMARASGPVMHERAKQGIADGLAALDLPGVTYELSYTDLAIAPVNNDPDLVRAGEAVIRKCGGDEAVMVIEETTPFFSEDFSFFQLEAPGVMYFMGVSNEESGHMGLPHHPDFYPDENAIGVGIKTMSMVLIDYLER